MDQKIVEDYIDELREMMDECPFLEVRMTEDHGVHICGNDNCPYCVNAIMDDICGNEEIVEFLEEKEQEADEIHS